MAANFAMASKSGRPPPATITSYCSGMVDAAMFRQEKLVKQAIDLQQAVAIETEPFGIMNQETLISQLADRVGESLLYIDAELAPKVTIPDLATLQLED